MKTPIEGFEWGEWSELIEKSDGAIQVVSYNQGGYDCTCTDLAQLFSWLKVNRPLLFSKLIEEA